MNIASNVLVPPSADPQEQTDAGSLPSLEEPMDMTQQIQDPPSSPPHKCYMGCPKGKAKPHTGDFSAHGSILKKNVWRNRVDEECIRCNIVYKKWKGLSPNQKSHVIGNQKLWSCKYSRDVESWERQLCTQYALSLY